MGCNPLEKAVDLMITDIIQQYNHFSIYGAHGVAYGAYCALKALYGRTPECFIVSDKRGNPDNIDGIPVFALDEAPLDGLIVLGVTTPFLDEIRIALESRGCHTVLAIRDTDEYELMSAYYRSIGKFPCLAPAPQGDPADLGLYEVRTHMDKPLRYEKPPLRSFEHSIQAGAALTERKIASILDSSGQQISWKNPLYCEMTAAYWVWKNTAHPWKGIEHYRRHLCFRAGDLNAGLDAIMPLPYMCYPDLAGYFCFFDHHREIRAMNRALRMVYPDAYDRYQNILHGKFFYPYNMTCARKTVFDDYCQWLFRVTEQLEELSREEPVVNQRRSLGYIAELLTCLYFMDHQSDLMIQHVAKEIYA